MGGFRFLNFPKIKIQLFNDNESNQKCLNLAKMGVSVSDISILDPKMNNGKGSKSIEANSNRRIYNFKNGKSCLFIEKISSLLNPNDESAELYILLENLLDSTHSSTTNLSS